MLLEETAWHMFSTCPSLKEEVMLKRSQKAETQLSVLCYSRDITVPHPKMGEYFLLLEARESFHEMLITAILDFPPDVANGPVPDFTIRRMGEAA